MLVRLVVALRRAGHGQLIQIDAVRADDLGQVAHGGAQILPPGGVDAQGGEGHVVRAILLLKAGAVPPPDGAALKALLLVLKAGVAQPGVDVERHVAALLFDLC